MTKLERFVEIFELPPAMIPHIDYVVTGQEMDLVVGLGKGEMTVPEIAQMMGLQQDEAEQLVISAFHRAVIKKAGAGYGHRGAPPAEGPTKYTSHNFYRRLDPLSMYEDWDPPAGNSGWGGSHPGCRYAGLGSRWIACADRLDGRISWLD